MDAMRILFGGMGYLVLEGMLPIMALLSFADAVDGKAKNKFNVCVKWIRAIIFIIVFIAMMIKSPL